MFLGMQGDYIANIAENREELESIAEVAGFTDIVETEEITCFSLARAESPAPTFKELFVDK